jgi:hypothetical protein
MKKTHTVLAAALLSSSTVSQIPVVPTVTCGRCGIPWNAKALTVRSGRCTCGAPFAPAPIAPVVCAVCGVLESRHFDGWDGTPLGCAEASRRWGGRAESFDALDARIAAECRRDAWDAD